MNRINLPVNQCYTIKTGALGKLDPIVIHRKNSLGFRGPEMPNNFANYLSIIVVGGSTTECMFLSDGKDWPSVLGMRLQQRYFRVWMNNAGLDGHSTFGHRILIDDYIVRIHPRIVLFLVGCNEVANDRLNRFDKYKLNGYSCGVSDFLRKNSRVYSVVVTCVRKSGWGKMDWNHSLVDLHGFATSQVSQADMEKTLAWHQRYLVLYEERLRQLIDDCRQKGIDPVFVTQPALYGDGIDPQTGVDLLGVQAGPGNNGALSWKILEAYNDVTRSVCSRKGIYLIDLALLMAKDSQYYYDFVHYTNKGSQKVAEIIAAALEPYLDIKYHQFVGQ